MTYTAGDAGHVAHHNDLENRVTQHDAGLNAVAGVPALVTQLATGTTPLNLSAKVGVALPDRAGEDVQHFTTTWTGQRWDLRSGTAAVPRAGGGPVFKISLTEKVTNLATQMGSNKADNAANAGLHVAVTSQTGSLAQPMAILGTAKGAPSGTDVCAGGFWGWNSGTSGVGYGLYVEGRRSVSTANAAGTEIRVQNEATADGVLNPSGFSDTIGAWVTASSSGGYKSAAGVSIGRVGTAQFVVGYHVSGGAVSSTAFRDDSSAGISFRSMGSHSTGVDLSGGTFTAYPISLPAATTAAAGGISFGNDAFLYRQAANSLNITATAGVTMDGTLTLADARNLVVGSTTGTKIGTSATQKLGFFGNTAVVRPTGWAAMTGTATRTTLATSTATTAQVAEHVKALIDDLTALGLIGA